MRIMQTHVLPNWVLKSQDPAQSLKVHIGVAPAKVLVDDAPLITKIAPLEVVVPDAENGIAFYAKDSETLIRGFKYLNDSGKTKGKREYFLRTRDESNLAAMSIAWEHERTTYSNAFTAGVGTVGFNTSLAIRRGIHKTTGIKIGSNDRYQSLSDNMERFSRDGKLEQRGCALYIVNAQYMPTQLKWGRVSRQIGDVMTFGIMATIAKRLFAD